MAIHVRPARLTSSLCGGQEGRGRQASGPQTFCPHPSQGGLAVGRAHQRAQSTLGFCGEGQGPLQGPAFTVSWGQHNPLPEGTVLWDPPKDPCLPTGGSHPEGPGPSPAGCGCGALGISGTPPAPAVGELPLPGQQEGGTCVRIGGEGGRGCRWPAEVGRAPDWVSPGRGCRPQPGVRVVWRARDHAEHRGRGRWGTDPTVLPRGPGWRGPPSCYCKWAGGFLFPRRVRLASAAPDKGASSRPAVSPPDHRVLGGAWGARLWLWSQQTGRRGGDPKTEPGRHS